MFLDACKDVFNFLNLFPSLVIRLSWKFLGGAMVPSSPIRYGPINVKHLLYMPFFPPALLPLHKSASRRSSWGNYPGNYTMQGATAGRAKPSP